MNSIYSSKNQKLRFTKKPIKRKKEFQSNSPRGWPIMEKNYSIAEKTWNHLNLTLKSSICNHCKRLASQLLCLKMVRGLLPWISMALTDILLQLVHLAKLASMIGKIGRLSRGLRRKVSKEQILSNSFPMLTMIIRRSFLLENPLTLQHLIWWMEKNYFNSPLVIWSLQQD